MNINELETFRKEVQKKILICSIVTISVSISLAFITGKFHFLIFSIVLGTIISYIICYKPLNKFTMEFKKLFVLKSLESIFTDLEYNPTLGLDEYIIRETQMMDMGDRYSSNDLIIGKYKNINIMQADVHIEEEHQTTDSNGHTTTTYVTIFKGRWMIFDFNKFFKANLQLCQKGFSNSKLNNWGNKEKFKKVMMEDEAFNKMFRIYAQNEHEAFYILTPSLMEKIKTLTTNINGKVLFCFIDNKLHVGLQNNKDSFEHSVFKKIDEKQIIENISKDIKLITNFVDELDLDNDLFRKEV